MELHELREELDALRGDDEDASESLQTIMVKLGQMAEADLRLTDDVEEEMGEELMGEMRRDLLGGILLATMEYAAEHDVDVEKAIGERLDALKEMKEQRDAIREAKENNDAEALAEALGADANEVPTGILEADEDDDDPRYIG